MDLAKIKDLAKNPPKNTTSNTITINSPLAQFGLDNLDCPDCGNTGHVIIRDMDGLPRSRECRCMRRRRSIRSLEKSGIKDQAERYTFGAFVADNKERAAIKRKAQEYAANPQGRWFLICGQSGSGKTHICTAVSKALIDKGFEFRYMVWRNDAPRIKALITDAEEYCREIMRLTDPHVLYIDDFYKGNVTEADINLAFQILDARYRYDHKITVISSERTLDGILAIDEAVGGRIKERAEGFVLRAPAVNWRLK